MKNKNNNGFTLIELLAVIVVLAIIMVIATTQVNKTIKKSRSNSFVESYQMLYKSVKTSAIQGNNCGETLDVLDIGTDNADYSAQVSIGAGNNLAVCSSTSSVTGTKYTLTLCAKGITPNGAATEIGSATGKFSNMNLLQHYNKSNGSGTLADITSNIGSLYTVTTHCITSSYDVSND